MRDGGWTASERTAVAGTPMYAAAFGPAGAPEVVCVHGLGCSHRYFLPFARALAPRRRVVAVDLPGFGRTPGPRRALDVRGLSLALAGWLRATGRGGAPLVANSCGCQVVIDLAVHAPELLGPVVLNGPTIDGYARTVPTQLYRLLLSGIREPASLGRITARDYVACGPRRFLGTFAAMLVDPVEDKLPLVRVPAAVARGTRDPIVPPAWARRVAELLPYGRLVEVPEAGHALNYDAPDALARITLDLVREAPDEERASGSGG